MMMKMKKIDLMIILFCLGTLLSAQTLTAKEIMLRVQNTPKPETSVTEVRLEIVRYKRGKEKVKVREFTRFRKFYHSGKFKAKSLVRFHKPLAVKGAGLLNWIYNSGKTDQWFFLPKLKTAKRIKTKEKMESFMGTNFIYEDLEDRKIGDDNLSIVSAAFYDGKQCTIIMAWPKNNSAYHARKIWVAKENYQIVKIEFYTDESVKEKTLTISEFETIKGYTTPRRMVMKNENGNKTIMAITDFKPNVGLKDEIFSESFLIKF